jgi:hypothetical protein
MSSNCASEFANVYTIISSISGNMNTYVSNVSSTYNVLNQMVSNQSNINNSIYSNGNINCGNIFANYVINNNGNIIIQNGNVNINNGNLILNGKIALGSDYGSTGQVLVSNGNTLPSWRSSMTRSITQSMNGLSSVPFTNIPSWANEIIIMFVNVSTNGTVVPGIEVGTSSGTYIVSGYLGTIWGNNGAGAANFSTNIRLWNTVWAASYVFHGIVRLYHMGGNVWNIQVNTSRSDAAPTNSYATLGEGRISVGAVLDRVRINVGANTFDAGSINIMYH